MIEPCGCVSHQLGGIDKEARLVEWLKEHELPTLKADAGGFMKDVPNDQAILASRFVLRALALMKYDAINVGYPDLSAGLKFLRDERTSLSLPLISANVLDATSSPIFMPYKIVPVHLTTGTEVRIGFIGVTRPRVQNAPVTMAMDTSWRSEVAVLPITLESGADNYVEEGRSKGGDRGGPSETRSAGETSDAYSITEPYEALQKYLPELRKSCDVVVLLSYATREVTSNLVKKLGNDSGIAIAIAGEWMQAAGNVTDVNGVRLVSAGFEGRQVGHMMVEISEKKVASVSNVLVEVVQSIPTVPAMTEIIAEYKKALAASSPAVSAGGGPVPYTSPDQKTTFSGAKACASCHGKEYDQWKTTRHASAMQTLVKRNAQYNPQCVRCHVTGYMVDNGFREYRNTPQMANVQCEVCHGPGFQHVVERRRAQIAAKMGGRKDAGTTPTVKMRMNFGEQSCSACHDAANDPRFDYKRDIKLVDHSKFAQRPEDAPVTRQTSATAVRAASPQTFPAPSPAPGMSPIPAASPAADVSPAPSPSPAAK